MSKRKFTSALKPFSRLSEIVVDCGNDFEVTVRQTAIYNQEYRSKATQWLQTYDRQNKGKKRKHVSVAGAFGVESITGTGDRQADIEYFIDVLLIGWVGLKDDANEEVPCNADNARELFGGSDEGWTLLQLLVQQSTNDSNFVAAEAADEAANIAKEFQPSSSTGDKPE